MSLAEEMLSSISVDDGIQTYSEIEEHIVVNDMRQIIVPNSLKTIAVTKDKDVQSITFDCVRYWDGNDLSTFAIYLNYVLPDMKAGTYIPKAIVPSGTGDFFQFEWDIESNITQKSGKITFGITALKTKTNEGGETVVDKQWSSLPNSDCSIASGLEISDVPTEEESAGILAQMSEILEEIQGSLIELVRSNVTQTTGRDTEKVISQAASSKLFGNAIKGNVYGQKVLIDDVSPIEHDVYVRLTSKNLIPFPYEGGSNVLSNGLTFTSQSDGGVKVNGTSTGKVYYGLATFNEGTLPGGKYSIRTEPTNSVRVLVESYKSGSWYKTLLQGDGVIDVDWNEYTSIKVLLYVYTGNTLSNVTIYPMMNKGAIPLPYSASVTKGTSVSVSILNNGSTQNVIMEVGNVSSLQSSYSAMEISTSRAGILFEVEYNRDATKVIEKLSNAIIALGGSV